MAILNFPDTTGQPTDGSFTYEENGVVYSWDGTKWTAEGDAAFWSRTGTILSPTNDGDNVQIGGGDIQLNANGSASFASNNFQIADDGIGTFGTNNSTGFHRMRGNNSSDQGAFQLQNFDATASAPVALFITETDSSATSNVLVNFGTRGSASSATGSGQIRANGLNAAAFGSWSDKRLKTDIELLPSQWDNIKNLKPAQFKFTSNVDAGVQVGFVAQEFQAVYPEAVAKGPYQTDKGTLEDCLSITGWGKTEAYLVKALQESITRIEQLEAEVAALKGGN